MKRAFLTLTVGLLSVFAAISCGSGGSSSLDQNKRIADLTPDEQKQLCDETARAQGGYGRKMICPDGHTETTDLDQAWCLDGLQMVAQYCPALTVGDGFDCFERQGLDICLYSTVSECQALRDCMASIPRS